MAARISTTLSFRFRDVLILTGYGRSPACRGDVDTHNLPFKACDYAGEVTTFPWVAQEGSQELVVATGVSKSGVITQIVEAE